MPDFCAAFGCCNERNAITKEQGITFHKFPKDKVKRQQWTVALRRKDFKPNDRSVVCSSHFNPEDFDRTGQTTRLKEGVVPSLFNFPGRPFKTLSTSRSTRTSQRAAAESPAVQKQECPLQVSDDAEETDHLYALHPARVKKQLTEALEKLEELQRKLRNAKDRERRYKRTMKSLHEELKHKNTLTKELQKKLDFYSHVLKCPASSFTKLKWKTHLGDNVSETVNPELNM